MRFFTSTNFCHVDSRFLQKLYSRINLYNSSIKNSDLIAISKNVHIKSIKCWVTQNVQTWWNKPINFCERCVFITNDVSRMKYLWSRIAKSYGREHIRWKSYREIPEQTKTGTETPIGVTQLQLYDGRRPRADPSRSLATRTIFLPACYRAFHFFFHSFSLFLFFLFSGDRFSGHSRP